LPLVYRRFTPLLVADVEQGMDYPLTPGVIYKGAHRSDALAGLL